MSATARRFESGPGFVRAVACPKCLHTRCGEDCRCDCWKRSCSAPGDCAEWAILCRSLPNGKVIHLVPMIFNARITLASERSNASGLFDDGWCYDKAVLLKAITAFEAWDGEGDPPGPWKKHVNTGRRGPGADIDPAEIDE